MIVNEERISIKYYDKDVFKQEMEFAREEHKQTRINEIRNSGEEVIS